MAVMGQGTILAHVFQHAGQWHFYDTVTSDMYECDEIVAGLIPYLNQLSEAKTRQELEKKWGADRVARTLTEIQEFSETTGALKPVDLEIVDMCSSRYDPCKYRDQIGHLQLTVSEQCNLRCEYCSYTRGRPGSRLHRDVYMSRETALAAADYFLDRCSATKSPAISFYGGEPLLNFPVIEAVTARVRSHPEGHRIDLTVDTNGLAIDEKIAEFLVREGFEVQLSLDGPAHLHDRYRKTLAGGGSHARTIAGLQRLLAVDRDFHRKVSFNVVLAPPYAVEEVVEYFEDFAPYRELGIQEPPNATLDFVDLSYIDFPQVQEAGAGQATPRQALVSTLARYHAECAAGRHEQMTPVLRSVLDHDLVGFFHRSRTRLTSGEFFPTGSCQPGLKKLHVRAEGSLLPCERGADRLFIGQISTGIDQNAVEDMYRKLVGAVKDRCRTCWAVRNCSTCFIHMGVGWDQAADGKVEIAEDFCRGARNSAEFILRNYLTLKKAGPQACAWLDETEMEE
jgi:uncharacterized protein